MNTVELSANQHSALAPLEMVAPVVPSMCADVAVTAAAVTLERGRVALEAARRLGILNFATHDVGFVGRHVVPGAAGLGEMSADELIALTA
ncbi:hypothetical protein ABJI51_15625 [Amycolatopsis sp. NEAU-NG30]|uniref:Uncharacterized protein n=1 Tax=Amycolatopsis melonis TaxID=3156488 RepID=A0ABV0LDZ7_9PSEU